jgi:hypothetical protein
MRSAEPVIFGVVKIVWKDGFAGIVDLRPILAKGEMFNFLRVNPARFDDLKLEDYGYCIFWLDDDNDDRFRLGLPASTRGATGRPSSSRRLNINALGVAIWLKKSICGFWASRSGTCRATSGR